MKKNRKTKISNDNEILLFHIENNRAKSFNQLSRFRIVQFRVNLESNANGLWNWTAERRGP